MSYILEPARSGRSSCKGRCKMPIPQDNWRLGSVADGPYPMTYWRCLPCVTAKQCSNILKVYNSFGAMMRAQGVEDPEEAKLLTAFFEAVHNGEEGTALALAHALNSGESYEAEDEEESESSEEEEVKPPPPKKSSSKKKAKGASAASAAAKPKKEEKKKDKGKAAAKPKPKPKAPRLSHGEWESAVLRALAAAAGQAGAAASAAAAQGMEATVVHDAVAADVGAAAYKKGQVTGALGRLETQGLAQQAVPAEAAAAEGESKKRKRKPLPLWSLTEDGRTRVDGESEEDEAEEDEAAAVVAPPPKRKSKPTKAAAAKKKKVVVKAAAASSGSKGKGKGKGKKAKAVKAEAEDGDDESEADAAKPKPKPKPKPKNKNKSRADAIIEPERLQRALEQRFYCLSGAIDLGDDTHTHPSGVFEVLSASSQRIYKVTFRVAAQPKRRGKGRGRGRQGEQEEEAAEEPPPVCIGSCNCPDSRVRGLLYSCKHQLFVACRILGLEAELEEGEGLPVGAFRDALNAPRLAHLRLTAEDYESVDVDEEDEEEEEEQAAAAADKGKGKAKAAEGVARKPLDADSECGVCFEALVEGAEGMSACKQCGNSIHTTCFAKWKAQSATRYGQAPSCVYCRATNSVVPV